MTSLPSKLPSEVAQLLSAAPRSLPLTQDALQHMGDGCSAQAKSLANLFSESRYPQGALAGLLLRLGCWPESHHAAQDIDSAEGSYWHGILHRMEPDSFNAGYWFRRVGPHAIFPDLLEGAAAILKASGPKHWRLKSAWDPMLFIEWCDEAREKGGELEAAATAIQMAEWELLFDWCARSKER